MTVAQNDGSVLWRGLVFEKPAIIETYAGRAAVVNAGQAGYYRTLYAPDLFATIATGFASLSAYDQMGLLSDYAALGSTGAVPVTDVLELVGRAKSDMDQEGAGKCSWSEQPCCVSSQGYSGCCQGEIALAQCVVYLATAPKSNAMEIAIDTARAAAKATGSVMPPAHILNAPTKLMSELGYGAGYQYDHDVEDSFSGQNYFPDGMARQNFYRPREIGFEREVLKRLDYWAKLRAKRNAGSANE